MTSSVGVIRQTDRGWELTVAEQTRVMTCDGDWQQEFVDAWQTLCGNHRAANRRCLITLHRSECFFATFPLPDGVSGKDQDALGFELERVLPLDAEAMVADYRESSDGTQVHAMAVQAQRFTALIRHLEAMETEIIAIVPEASLIARAVAREVNLQQPFYLLINPSSPAQNESPGSSGCEWILISQEGFQQWTQFPGGQADLQRDLNVMADRVDHALPVVCGGEPIAIALANPVIALPAPIEQIEQCFQIGVNQVIAGGVGRWPDFRRGELAPADPLYAIAKPLKQLTWALVASLLVIAIGATVRERWLMQASEQLQQRKTAAYREVFPDRRVPVAVMSAVRNEYRRVLGTRGNGDAVERPVPATDVLRAVFSALRQTEQLGIEFVINDVAIENGSLQLSVRVNEFSQIGTITTHLEQQGFDVQDPSSDQVPASNDLPHVTYQSTIQADYLGAQTPLTLDTDQGSVSPPLVIASRDAASDSGGRQ